MTSRENTVNIPASQLEIGMYVYLDVHWWVHPFAKSHFKISDAKQIAQLQQLHIDSFRVVAHTVPHQEQLQNQNIDTPEVRVPMMQATKALASDSNIALAQIEKTFTQLSALYKQAIQQLRSQPHEAKTLFMDMNHTLIEVSGGTEAACLRVLQDVTGDKPSLHALNVSVLSLMLARAAQVSSTQLECIGLAALLHDVGKQNLPARVQYEGPHFTAIDTKYYQEHVSRSSDILGPLHLPPLIYKIVAQHHEYCDGQGFPHKLGSTDIAFESKIVTIADRFDTLCHLGPSALSITPHEALRTLYSQEKLRYDASLLELFVKRLGVYPPGSLVQLNNDKYAMVVNVNPGKMLRPLVLVYKEGIDVEHAELTNLRSTPELTIRRSLRPSQTPDVILDYFMQRSRLCYFFEPGQYVLQDVKTEGRTA